MLVRTVMLASAHTSPTSPSRMHEPDRHPPDQHHGSHIARGIDRSSTRYLGPRPVDPRFPTTALRTRDGPTPQALRLRLPFPVRHVPTAQPRITRAWALTCSSPFDTPTSPCTHGVFCGVGANGGPGICRLLGRRRSVMGGGGCLRNGAGGGTRQNNSFPPPLPPRNPAGRSMTAGSGNVFVWARHGSGPHSTLAPGGHEAERDGRKDGRKGRRTPLCTVLIIWRKRPIRANIPFPRCTGLSVLAVQWRYGGFASAPCGGPCGDIPRPRHDCRVAHKRQPFSPPGALRRPTGCP